MNPSINRSDRWLRNITLVVMTCNLLNSLFPVPPMVFRLMLLLLCLYVFLHRWNILTKLEKWMTVFCGVNFIYFLLAFVSRSVSATHVANNLCAFLPICIFIHLSRRGVMTDKFMTIMTIVLLLGSIGYYINYERMRVLSFGMEDSDNLTINASTVFLMLLPLLFFEKNKVLFYFELAICVFFIVSAVKRGNIVASVIPIGLLMLYQYQQSKKNLFTMLLLLAVVVVGSNLLREYILSNSYFLSRVDDTMMGESSNRNRIYRSAFLIWWNSDLLNVFVGNGYRAVARSIGVAAHNDWLEILADNGILGFVIYLGIFIELFKQLKKTTIQPDKLVMISAVFIWGVKSLVSMAYVENYLFLLMISIGFVIGRYKSSNQLENG